MLNMLFCVYLIAALLNGFLLGGSLWWSLLAAVISLAFLVSRMLFAKKVQSAVIRSASILGVVILLLIGLWSGMKTTGTGYISYNASMTKIDSLLERKEFYKAGEILDKLEKDYVSSDRLQLYKAQAAIGKKDIPLAEACLSRVANKQSDQYYRMLGWLYMLKNDYKKVQETYVNAAKAYPLWSEAQRIAGTQSVNNKDYSIGEYFLLRAFEQAPTDPIPLYYIGVIRYEQSNYPEADKYFSEALQLGINDEFAGYIAWYRQQMGGDKQ